jgi:hypothetical protein
MSYVNNQWSFPFPDCPSCCLIRAKQGFPMPGAFGDYCPPCALQRKLDAYHKSPEYLAWRALLDAFQAGLSVVDGTEGPVGVTDIIDVTGSGEGATGATGATGPAPPPLTPEEALAAWHEANPQPTVPQ